MKEFQYIITTEVIEYIKNLPADLIEDQTSVIGFLYIDRYDHVAAELIPLSGESYMYYLLNYVFGDEVAT